MNASNVDPFLAGRAASHLWSHQIAPDAPPTQSSLGAKGRAMLAESLENPKGAMVLWVRAGHEVRNPVSILNPG